jgi:hypothetical protein
MKMAGPRVCLLISFNKLILCHLNIYDVYNDSKHFVVVLCYNAVIVIHL